MNKISIIILLCISILSASTAIAGNPFTSKPDQKHSAVKPSVSSKPAVASGFFVKIVMWQQQLRQKMAQLIRSVQTTKNMTPVFFLAALSFAYGVIHSAGPGHGKALALSYILSCKPTVSQGLIFGNLVALTHGFSGIIFILAVKFLFQTQISGSLEVVTKITQILSFSLIFILGLVIFLKSMYKWIKRASPSQTRNFSNPYITALVVGIIPCPGVVMVMLFAISLNLTWLGILLGTFISIGMAFTISCIVMLGIAGKTSLLSTVSAHNKMLARIEVAIETIAGLFLAGISLFFLLTLI